MAQKTELLPKSKRAEETELAGKHQLILMNDDDHSYAYVIEMVMTLFGHSYEDAYQVAYDVDYLGEAVVKICPLEEAMVGREQIVNYGADPRIPASAGSMYAIVRKAGE
jgi:ATP-dependent Clp protease adaptor protein ClpS